MPLSFKKRPKKKKTTFCSKKGLGSSFCCLTKTQTLQSERPCSPQPEGRRARFGARPGLSASAQGAPPGGPLPGGPETREGTSAAQALSLAPPRTARPPRPGHRAPRRGRCAPSPCARPPGSWRSPPGCWGSGRTGRTQRPAGRPTGYLKSISTTVITREKLCYSQS